MSNGGNTRTYGSTNKRCSTDSRSLFQQSFKVLCSRETTGLVIQVHIHRIFASVTSINDDSRTTLNSRNKHKTTLACYNFIRCSSTTKIRLGTMGRQFRFGLQDDGQ